MNTPDNGDYPDVRRWYGTRVKDGQRLPDRWELLKSWVHRLLRRLPKNGS